MILEDGMKRLGFQKLLDHPHEGYIITSFRYPTHANFKFNEFYSRLNELGKKCLAAILPNHKKMYLFL